MWVSLPNTKKCDNNVKNAQAQRNTLCEYFVFSAGKVEWQYDFIRRGAHVDDK